MLVGVNNRALVESLLRQFAARLSHLRASELGELYYFSHVMLKREVVVRGYEKAVSAVMNGFAAALPVGCDHYLAAR